MNDITTVDSDIAQMVNSAEFNQLTALAHRYPRKTVDFINEAITLATRTHEFASDCFYAVPRKDDDGNPITIEGPNARFFETISYAWKNHRSGARIIEVDAKFVTAQGVFLDLERNISITVEVKRRITYKNGNRYSDDMITSTANAAASFALRNATKKAIPKALWQDVFREVMDAVKSKAKKPLKDRIKDALAFMAKFGLHKEQCLKVLKINNESEIKEGHLKTLRGYANALRDGVTTVEQILGKTTAEETKEKPATKKKRGRPKQTETPPAKGKQSSELMDMLEAIGKALDFDQLGELAKKVNDFTNQADREMVLKAISTRNDALLDMIQGEVNLSINIANQESDIDLIFDRIRDIPDDELRGKLSKQTEAKLAEINRKVIT